MECSQVCWNSVVEEAYGNEKGLLGGVKLKDVKTGELRDIQVGKCIFWERMWKINAGKGELIY